MLTVALMQQRLRGNLTREITARDFDAVRQQCVFTTHTPVPAGHDRFTLVQTYRILGLETATLLECMGGSAARAMLNLTHVALAASRFVKQQGRHPARQHLAQNVLRICYRLHQTMALTRLPGRRLRYRPSLTASCPAGERTISNSATWQGFPRGARRGARGIEEKALPRGFRPHRHWVEERCLHHWLLPRHRSRHLQARRPAFSATPSG